MTSQAPIHAHGPSEQAASAAEPTLCWRAHPAGERVGRALVAGAVVAGLAGLSAVLMQSVWWAALAIAVLVLALNRFFLPSRFAIDEEGITARYPLRRVRYRWSDLRRFVLDENGGYLSTRARASWMDAYRGMHVLFGNDRDAVVAGIRGHMPQGDGPWAS
ncbi:MAG: PH domain-containing protein [Planctomycetota bacterium]